MRSVARCWALTAEVRRSCGVEACGVPIVCAGRRVWLQTAKKNHMDHDTSGKQVCVAVAARYFLLGWPLVKKGRYSPVNSFLQIGI